MWLGIVDARTCALRGNDGKKMKTEQLELGVCGNCQMRAGRAVGVHLRGLFEGDTKSLHGVGACIHVFVREQR